MKTVYLDGVKVRRELNDTDNSGWPLPYGGVNNLTNEDTTVTDGSTSTVDFTDTDWGTDLDFYYNGITVILEAASAWDISSNEGVFIKVHEPTSGEVLFTHTISDIRETPTSSGSQHSFNFAYYRRLSSSQTLRVDIENNTGDTLTTITIYISGIAV